MFAEPISHELRFVQRFLTRNKEFTAMAAIALALGIGPILACSACFPTCAKRRAQIRFQMTICDPYAS
jgi:hypothetical protein